MYPLPTSIQKPMAQRRHRYENGRAAFARLTIAACASLAFGAAMELASRAASTDAVLAQATAAGATRE